MKYLDKILGQFLFEAPPKVKPVVPKQKSILGKVTGIASRGSSKTNKTSPVPPGLDYDRTSWGRYFKGNVYLGRVEGGKWIPASEEPEPKSKSKTTDTNPRKSKPQKQQKVKSVVSPIDRLKLDIKKRMDLVGKKLPKDMVSDSFTLIDSLNKKDAGFVNYYINKYQLFYSKRAGGLQIYSALGKRGDPKLDTMRKPFGTSKLVNQTIYDLFIENGYTFPTEEDINGVSGAAYSLFTSEIFGGIENTEKIDIKRDPTNPKNISLFSVGDTHLKYVDPSKHRNKSPEIQQQIELYNEQIRALSALVSDSGEVQAKIISGPNAQKIIRDRISIAIRDTSGVTPERFKQINSILINMEKSSPEEFDILAKDFVKTVMSKNDVLNASRAYLAESIAIFREAKLGSKIIIPTSSSFSVGDFISISPKKMLPGLISVTLNFDSVKFDAGNQSSQFAKIKLTQYKSSKYGSGEDIKKQLMALTSSEKGSLYNKIWHGSEQDMDEALNTINKLFKKYGPLIQEYYGFDNIDQLRKAFMDGRTPHIIKGKVSHPGPIPALKDKKCKHNQRRWQLYNQLGHLVDVVNNSHMERQGFRNINIRSSGRINTTTGGFNVNGTRIIGKSKFRPDKSMRNCKPGSAFAAKIIATDMNTGASLSDNIEEEYDIMINEQFDGLSKGMTLKDIAKKHDVSLGDIAKELARGIQVEKEHTSSVKLATQIAKDHLVEDPKYYTKLKKVEKVEDKCYECEDD